MLQEVVVPGAMEGSLGLTGQVTEALPFASEEGKGAVVQLLPDDFMWYLINELPMFPWQLHAVLLALIQMGILYTSGAVASAY